MSRQPFLFSQQGNMDTIMTMVMRIMDNPSLNPKNTIMIQMPGHLTMDGREHCPLPVPI